VGADQYWVGERRDSDRLWLYDPSLVHDDPEMVYLFQAGTADVHAHPKAFVKTILTTVKDARRAAVVEEYLKWHEKHGSDFVVTDRRQRQELAERRREEAIAKHKAYLEKHKKQYAGVTKGSSKQHRTTHCYRCKDNLDSSLHVQCMQLAHLLLWCMWLRVRKMVLNAKPNSALLTEAFSSLRCADGAARRER
jgi:hypothetical protein